MDKFRLLAQKEEIFKMVKKAPVVEIGEIWQTLPFKREIYRIKRMEVLSEAMIFHTNLPFDFQNDFPIYIKLNYKNLIFKLSPSEFKTYNNQLSCSYPKEAKAVEDRSLDRTKLPKRTSLHMTIRTLSTESVFDLKVSLDDISESGLGIRTSSANIEYFGRNSVFKIIKVCGRNHMEEATLSVRHISEKDHKSFIGIGLSANQPFSEKLFEILREEIKKERFVA